MADPDDAPLRLTLPRTAYTLSGCQWENLSSEFYGKVLDGALVTGTDALPIHDDLPDVIIEFEQPAHMTSFKRALRCFTHPTVP